MYILEGKLVPKKIRVGIVASRFNEFITSRLLSGALDCLRRHEVPEDDITVAWVPGAFEIPLIASRMAASRRYDAENIEQAIERAGTKAGNKGYDCAAGAIEMVNLIHELDKRTADNSLSVTPFVQEEPCRP